MAYSRVNFTFTEVNRASLSMGNRAISTPGVELTSTKRSGWEFAELYVSARFLLKHEVIMPTE